MPRGAASAVVAIQATLEDGRNICTGTLISPRVVLTAAHCLIDVKNETQLTVSLHAIDLRTLPPPTALFYTVTKFLSHPGFQTKEGVYDQTNDLALLLIDRAVPLSTQLAELAGPEFDLSQASRVMTFGYGVADDRLNTDDEGSRVLRTTSFSHGLFGVLPWPKMPAGLPSVEKYARMIGSIAQTTSICHGDSGGPLFAVSGSATVLVGVSDMVLPAYPGQQGRDYENAVKNGTLADFAAKYPDARVCMGGWNVFVNLLPHLAWIKESAEKLTR